jgi:hypothetical protein
MLVALGRWPKAAASFDLLKPTCTCTQTWVLGRGQQGMMVDRYQLQLLMHISEPAERMLAGRPV